MNSTIYHTENLQSFSFLITGGAGFIGSNLAGYLLRHNAGKVRVLDNLSTGSPENIKDLMGNPAFELIEGDIRNLKTCEKALEGIHFVSHQAALGSVPRSVNDPLTTNDVNINGMLNMLQAARQTPSIKRMVYAASSSTYGDSKALPKVEGQEGRPLSPYAITKLVNELYADVFSCVYGFHTIGLRYFNIFGPWQSPNGAYAAAIPLFIHAAMAGKQPTINGDGSTSRDFTFVDNAVQANVKALLGTPTLTRHEVVNIACGECTSLNELWSLIQEIVGCKIAPVYGPERPGDILHSLADISKAASLFGYQPEWTIKDGLKEAVKFYQHQIYR